MTKIKNSVIWITGASSGIGEALAYSMAFKGAKLILSARRIEALENVKANCKKNGNSAVKILPLDVSDEDSLASSSVEAKSLFGGIDILINNAGISQRGLAKDILMEVERRVFEVNYFGTVALTKLVLADMIERKTGHIVVVSSTAGMVSTPLRSSYAASKHALHGHFNALRSEVHDDNIKVTIVCPGFINTEITKKALKSDGSELNEMGEAQKKGMDVNEFTKKMVRAIEQNSQEVHIHGFKEGLALFLKRFFPSLLSILIRKMKST